ncbi:MAG: SDR family oxidoreductase [SAR202 cluster bacterium]|jgi:3-oxoacyl-[acyl-carrier protein] reductase|nr:SDR family oxidoreductase [SAR202 cluster bacterium]
MDLGIKGKVALVTGGSRGLGRQAALSLAAEGVNVAICGRTKDTLDGTVSDIKALGVDSLSVVADVSDQTSLDSLHAQVVAGLGPVDILVNNAGGSRARTDIAETSLDDYKATFDLNLFGSFQLMRLAIPHMRSQGWGRIINIASIWGREQGGNISYMSAKAALIAATKNAAVSLGKDGILVNSIAPGSIAHAGGSWERFQRDNPPEMVQSFIDQNLPLGKFGWPEPLGDLIAFLASERAGLITGACIVVDGGQGISMI